MKLRVEVWKIRQMTGATHFSRVRDSPVRPGDADVGKRSWGTAVRLSSLLWRPEENLVLRLPAFSDQ